MPLEGAGEEAREMEEDLQAEAEEAARPVRRKAPDRPSQREIDEHELYHEPYRSWCRACVAGRGMTHDAHRPKSQVNEIPRWDWITGT
jgi:hypothetical protein